MTGFFVPGAEPDRSEARYAELAATVDAVVLRPADRVLSVRFPQGAEEWVATVGERLSGQLTARTDRRPAPRASRSAPAREVSDPATVLAVFDMGDRYLVLTDARPLGTIDDSTWDNPFSIPGRTARRVRRFGD